MKLSVHRFLASKRGTDAHECEDALAAITDRMVFAVADGATEAYDARTWARLLVKGWVRIQPAPVEVKDFGPLVRDLGFRLNRRWSKRQLPWYAEEKAKGGSFAAFIGLQLYLLDGTIHWKSIALGDCCLIHRDGSGIYETFPIVKSEEFGNNPILLPSSEQKQRHAIDFIRIAQGTSMAGHEFLLLSDAVGWWFLKQLEEGSQEPIQAFDRLTESDDIRGLTAFFEELRNEGRIKNDDIAALRIAVL